ncbi:hypothetical protein [Solidesulfovibrio sp.]|uniref:hypothetical protein n=1 Tax=Solidesulfovibrio sp. TaxID=2910990 RepID=UPI002632CAE7|nr:hypothetical protein [Solidesulfovibrio sp.]
MTPGRPKKTRIAGSGDKLRRGLELLGRTWGKTTQAESHVFQDGRWARCGLPKSVNTVAEDMRCGIPSDRLAGYAAYLGIPIELLADEALGSNDETLVAALFAAREELDAPQHPIWTMFGAAFHRQYFADNTEVYLASLFRVLAGVYSLSCVFLPNEEAHCGCCLVSGIEGHALAAKGVLFHGNEELPFVAGIFRWGSNLHVAYHFRDARMLGRMMAEDPLRHFALAHRKPFRLDCMGVGDALAAPETCAFVRCRAERLEPAKPGDPEGQFRQACLTLRQRAGGGRKKRTPPRREAGRDHAPEQAACPPDVRRDASPNARQPRTTRPGP